MASLEWLREHRELQYLRAATWEYQLGTRSARIRRRRYADLRWRKLQAVNPRFSGQRRWNGAVGPSTAKRDQERD
jgi:hypothetical protein